MAKVIKLDKELQGYDCPFKYVFSINDRDQSDCCSVLDGADCSGTGNEEVCPLRKHKKITVEI